LPSLVAADFTSTFQVLNQSNLNFLFYNAISANSAVQLLLGQLYHLYDCSQWYR